MRKNSQQSGYDKKYTFFFVSCIIIYTEYQIVAELSLRRCLKMQVVGLPLLHPVPFWHNPCIFLLLLLSNPCFVLNAERFIWINFATMFTGIVETVGKILDISASGHNLSFWLEADITRELKVDQSVSHDGICLTVEAINESRYQVTAIEETIRKSNISEWQIGKTVNLERCMTLGGRLDGHIVQGHVDATGTCLSVTPENGSYLYRFSFPKPFNHLIIEKGSIAVSGTSLTCFDVGDGVFSVAIIPYTYQHTSISQLKPGDLVNLEFDVIGKYIARMQAFTVATKH